MNHRITMGNDEFILYIRKWHPECRTKTKQLGKEIWMWLRNRKAQKLNEQPQHKY